MSCSQPKMAGKLPLELTEKRRYRRAVVPVLRKADVATGVTHYTDCKMSPDKWPRLDRYILNAKDVSYHKMQWHDLLRNPLQYWVSGSGLFRNVTEMKIKNLVSDMHCIDSRFHPRLNLTYLCLAFIFCVNFTAFKGSYIYFTCLHMRILGFVK